MNCGILIILGSLIQVLGVEPDYNELLRTVTRTHTNSTIKYFDVGSDKMTKSKRLRDVINGLLDSELQNDCLKKYHKDLKNFNLNVWQCHYDDDYRKQRETLALIDSEVHDIGIACGVCRTAAEDGCYDKELSPRMDTLHVYLQNMEQGLGFFQERYDSCYDAVEVGLNEITNRCL